MEGVWAGACSAGPLLSGSLLRCIVPAVIVCNRSHVRTTSARFYSSAAPSQPYTLPVLVVKFRGEYVDKLRRLDALRAHSSVTPVLLSVEQKCGDMSGLRRWTGTASEAGSSDWLVWREGCIGY